MSHAYGEKNDMESIETLHLALDLGINFWDTADFYGNGVNEELISKVLAPNRDKIFIATKFGFKPNASNVFELDCSPNYLKAAVEASLRRLARARGRALARGVELYQHRAAKLRSREAGVRLAGVDRI